MRSTRRRYVRRMPKIYGNLQPKQRRWSFAWVGKFLRTIIPLAVIAGVIYFVIAGTFFKVRDVEVLGARLVEPSVIAELVPRGGNIWSFPKAELADEIRKNPAVEDVQILRGLPDGIRIEVAERSAAALWVNGNTGFVLDDDGIAFLEYQLDQLPAEETVVGQTLRTLPKVVDLSGLSAKLSEQVASTLFLAFVGDVQEQMGLLLPGYNVTGYEVGATTYDVTLVTNGGPRIFLNSLGDAGVQIRNVARLVRDGKLDGAQSVDLRIDRWAYVR